MQVQSQYSKILKYISRDSQNRGTDGIPLFEPSDGFILGLQKFLMALVIPIALLLIGIWGEKGEDRRDMVLAFITIGLVSGLIAVFVPVIHQPWVNHLGIVILQLIAIVLLAALTSDEE